MCLTFRPEITARRRVLTWAAGFGLCLAFETMIPLRKRGTDIGPTGPALLRFLPGAGSGNGRFHVIVALKAQGKEVSLGTQHGLQLGLSWVVRRSPTRWGPLPLQAAVLLRSRPGAWLARGRGGGGAKGVPGPRPRRRGLVPERSQLRGEGRGTCHPGLQECGPAPPARAPPPAPGIPAGYRPCR